MGLNVNKLVIRKFTLLVVPNGGGLQSALEALIDSEKRIRLMREAKTWVDEAIRLVRIAPGCKWTTDEEIAGEILRQIDERKKHGG